MEKGCASRQYILVTDKRNDFPDYTLPVVESIRSAKSVIIFIILSVVLLVGISLLPESPVALSAQQYQSHYQPQ